MDCSLALIGTSILFENKSTSTVLGVIKKILWKAGKWIAKIRKPYAPKSFANLDNFLIIKWRLLRSSQKQNNPKFLLKFRAIHFN